MVAVGEASEAKGKPGAAVRLSHRSYLTHANYRHLKLAVAGLVVAIGAFVLYEPVGGRNGGTWVGYALGGLSAGLIGWLTWFGVRKRSYASRGASLQGWLSAHVYLGAALLVLVPLHSGFQFGWNVHTLAYALMSAAILSGMFGVGMYGYTPSLMTRNRGGNTLESFYEEIRDLDTECEKVAMTLPDEYARVAAGSLREAGIGGGLLRRLSGRDPGCRTAQAARMIKARSTGLDEETQALVGRLLQILARKSAVLVHVRRDVRHRTLLNLWLALHVPLAVATVVAVVIHVFVVFYYW